MSARPWRKRRNMTPRRVRKWKERWGRTYVRLGPIAYALDLQRRHCKARGVAWIDFSAPLPRKIALTLNLVIA